MVGKVTVICLCFNHEKYVIAALNSVLGQTYSNIELIVIDDASPDGSAKIITDFMKEYEGEIPVSFFPFQTNRGNCKAFNFGLQKAKGEYIIDLAADDMLLPNSVEKQIAAFGKLDDSYAVVFSDVYYINENSEILKTHFQRDKNGKLAQFVPQGDIYKPILAKSFLSATSMMMRKKVLDEIGGYDETLSYEDYDFWIKSARKYQYHFIDDILVKKRILKNSHGRSFYLKNNKHLLSTLKVHEKAYAQNRSKEENLALAVSVRYHLRLSFYTEHFELVTKYANLLKKLDTLDWKDQIIVVLTKMKMRVFRLYQIYSS